MDAPAYVQTPHTSHLTTRCSCPARPQAIVKTLLPIHARTRSLARSPYVRPHAPHTFARASTLTLRHLCKCRRTATTCSRYVHTSLPAGVPRPVRRYASKSALLSRKSITPTTIIPSSVIHGIIQSLTIIIFLKLSGI